MESRIWSRSVELGVWSRGVDSVWSQRFGVGRVESKGWSRRYGVGVYSWGCRLWSRWCLGVLLIRGILTGVFIS